jgi:hypothetical protein
MVWKSDKMTKRLMEQNIFDSLVILGFMTPADSTQ